MFNNLPQEESFQNKFEFFLSDIQYMRYYIPNWEYPFTKNELIDRTLEFNSIINEQINPSYDLGILATHTVTIFVQSRCRKRYTKNRSQSCRIKRAKPCRL